MSSGLSEVQPFAPLVKVTLTGCAFSGVSGVNVTITLSPSTASVGKPTFTEPKPSSVVTAVKVGAVVGAVSSPL